MTWLIESVVTVINGVLRTGAICGQQACHHKKLDMSNKPNLLNTRALIAISTMWQKVDDNKCPGIDKI